MHSAMASVESPRDEHDDIQMLIATNFKEKMATTSQISSHNTKVPTTERTPRIDVDTANGNCVADTSLNTNNTDNNNENNITVECSNGELMQVDIAVATKMSVALRNKLATLDSTSIVHLDNITARALAKVLEYCHVHTHPFPQTSPVNLKEWDEKFVKLDPGTLCELASAAYHLEIKPLVDLTCQAIAQLLKGKSPAEIRKTFNILYDFNPEDDAPPPTIRDKLRNKLCNPKRTRNKTKQQRQPKSTENVIDTRSVEDLVSFIDGSSSKSGTKKSSRAAKRARQRERKRKLKKSKEALTVSTDKSEGGLLAENCSETGVHTTEHEPNEGEAVTQELKPSNLATGKEKPLKNVKMMSEECETPKEETEFEDIDSEHDKEVEEFRKRLAQINTTQTKRKKIALPDNLSAALVESLKG